MNWSAWRLTLSTCEYGGTSVSIRKEGQPLVVGWGWGGGGGSADGIRLTVCDVVVAFPSETLGVTWYRQLSINKCIPWGERIACAAIFVYYPTTWAATHHLHRICLHFGGGGQMLLCKNIIIMTEDIPHITQIFSYS